MLDTKNKSDMVALWNAMRTSWRHLRPFRENKNSVIEDYVGSEWGSITGGRRKKKARVLTNLLSMTARTYQVALAANRPRVMVTTEQMDLKPFSRRFEKAINNLIKEIKFEKTLRDVVLDAFFSVGIVKTFRAAGNEQEVMNTPDEPGEGSSDEEWEQYTELLHGTTWVDVGKPFVQRVSLDDFGYDTSAVRFEDSRFMWHQYRVPLSALQADDRLDQKRVSKLTATSKWTDTIFEGREQRTEDMTSGSQRDHDEVESMVTILDVYLPYEKKWMIMTGGHEMIPLYVADWDGPESGPFCFLRFDDVPDNAMPLAPAQNLRQLHLLANSLARKQARQAERQKDITGYMGDERDGRAVRDANDGEIVRLTNPDSIAQLKYGGVDAGNMAFSQVVSQMFDEMSGNLSAKAGLGPQSGTAKQDELIHGAVDRQEAKMQYAVTEFVGEICESLGQMLWYDDFTEMAGTLQDPGMMFPVDASWTPEMREGNLVQYGFDIEPHSTEYRSPQQTLMQTRESLNALAPFMQMSGVIPDVTKLVELEARMSGNPHLREMFTAMPPAAPAPGAGDPAAGANKPNGNYTRTNVSAGGTPANRRMGAAQNFMAAAGEQG